MCLMEKALHVDAAAAVETVLFAFFGVRRATNTRPSRNKPKAHGTDPTIQRRVSEAFGISFVASRLVDWMDLVTNNVMHIKAPWKRSKCWENE